MQIDQNKLRLSLKKIVILTLETLKKEEKKKETTIHVIKIVGIFLDSHFQLHDILSRFRSSSSTFCKQNSSLGKCSLLVKRSLLTYYYVH